MDSTHEVLRDIALFSVSFANLVKELEKELEAHVALIGRLEERITSLELKAERPHRGLIEMISNEGLLDDYVNEKISDHLNEDQIREWARDEADEVLRNASFSVTVD